MERRESNIITRMKELLQQNGECKFGFKNTKNDNSLLCTGEFLLVEVKDISEVIEGIPLGATKQFSVDLEYQCVKDKYKLIKGHKIYTDIDVFFNELQKDLENFGFYGYF